MHHHRALRRPSSSTSSTASTASWGSHNGDAAQAQRRPSMRSFENHNDAVRGRQNSATSTSSRSCEGMSADETGELWKCMLELQRQYGCYNSTRIDLAMNAGEAGLYLMRKPLVSGRARPVVLGRVEPSSADGLTRAIDQRTLLSSTRLTTPWSTSPTRAGRCSTAVSGLVR